MRKVEPVEIENLKKKQTAVFIHRVRSYSYSNEKDYVWETRFHWHTKNSLKAFKDDLLRWSKKDRLFVNSDENPNLAKYRIKNKAGVFLCKTKMVKKHEVIVSFIKNSSTTEIIDNSDKKKYSGKKFEYLKDKLLSFDKDTQIAF